MQNSHFDNFDLSKKKKKKKKKREKFPFRKFRFIKKKKKRKKEILKINNSNDKKFSRYLSQYISIKINVQYNNNAQTLKHQF